MELITFWLPPLVDFSPIITSIILFVVNRWRMTSTLFHEHDNSSFIYSRQWIMANLAKGLIGPNHDIILFLLIFIPFVFPLFSWNKIMQIHNHQADQQWVLGFDLPFANLHTMHKTIGPKSFCWAKSTYFDLSSFKICCTCTSATTLSTNFITSKYYILIINYFFYMLIQITLINM